MLLPLVFCIFLLDFQQIPLRSLFWRTLWPSFLNVLYLKVLSEFGPNSCISEGIHRVCLLDIGAESVRREPCS